MPDQSAGRRVEIIDLGARISDVDARAGDHGRAVAATEDVLAPEKSAGLLANREEGPARGSTSGNGHGAVRGGRIRLEAGLRQLRRPQLRAGSCVERREGTA